MRTYPPIPAATHFQRDYGYQVVDPGNVHRWEWSTTFGRWSALVTFPDGFQTWTFPRPN